MKKRTVAIAFLAVVLALGAATLLVLRTRWAGERLCALAAARAESATGLALSFGSCRVDPLALAVEVQGVRLGPPAAPLFTADAVKARLVALQALGGRVRIAALRLVRPRVVFHAPPGDGAPGRCPPAALSHVEVRELDVSDGSVDLTVGGVRVTASSIDLRAARTVHALRALAGGVGKTRLELAASGVRVEGAGDRPFTSRRAELAAEVVDDLSVAEVTGADADVDGVRITARGRVRDLCAPSLDVVATASGPFRDVLALTRIHPDAPAEGNVFAEGRVSGPAAHPEVKAKVRLERARVGWFRAGDVRGEIRLVPGGLAIERAEWPLPGATVSAHGKIGFGAGVPLEAEVETGGADLADILDRVGIEGSWVTVKLDGRGKLAGTLVPTRKLTGSFAGEFRDLRSYDRSWRTAAARASPIVHVERGRVETPVDVTDERLAFEGARVTAGRGTSELDALTRFSLDGGFQVRWRGQVDLDAIREVAGVPCGGLADVDAAIGAAPYGNPRILGRTRVEALRYLDISLGSSALDFDYGPDFLLRVRGAEGLRGQTRWSGEGVVDLEATPPRVISSRFEAKGRVRDLFDAVQDWLPRTRQFRGAIDGNVEVSGTASGPAGALDGTFEARMASGTLYGRPFDSGRASGTFERGEEARFERAELRRGAGLLHMTGRYGFAAPFPWGLDLSFAGLPLADAGLPGGEWSGTASGTATLRGSFEHPDVRFAANGGSVTLRGLPLGTLQAAGTLLERRVLVTGSAEGLAFEGEATLDGPFPFRARADVALDDLERLLPPGTPAGLQARARGEVTAEGELTALDAARVRARIDELQVRHADLRIQAAGPAVLLASHGRVEVEALTLVGPNTELTVAGARAASGQLDVSAGGTLDLRLLSGLVPGMKVPHGQLGLEAHVSGTFEEPVLVGAGRLQDAGFQLKGASTVVSELRGALAFSQNRVLFEDLTASVNGGRATLRGEVELASFVPVRLRIEAALDEIPVAVPAYLPATLSGRVEAAGTPDATIVTGRLHVVRARYTADVDLERSLLELRRPAPPPRPYDRAGEWLRFDLQLAVDGDVRIDNDLVRGAVKGELTLTGTLAAPGLVGTLAMADGSRAQFRGNEFALGHAVLEFTDRNKIEIALDVHGDAKVRDYQIFMHAFGLLADPHLTLTSAPPLSQPDIITLLSLGFTRRDASASTGVSGVATAAAAQALFSASGLDEQVKRFLPRSDVVRDVSVRMTSEWSEASQQVEPRAEFESWLMDDRLRLRFQAPLSGARGQKAQAELRLGPHTAVQYQWDSDNPDARVTGDHGIDLKLRWEWTDE